MPETDLRFGNYFGCGLPEDQTIQPQVRPGKRRTASQGQHLSGNYFGCGFQYAEAVDHRAEYPA